MKQLNYLFIVVAVILSSTFTMNAQSDTELFNIFAESMENGMYQEMSKPEWKGTMTGATCRYNGQDIVSTIEYTFNSQNSTPKDMELLKNSLSEKDLKIALTHNLSLTINSNAEIKDLFVDIFKRNQCDFVYNVYYNFPDTTKHINFSITIDELIDNPPTKEEFINTFITNYRKAMDSEIGKNGIINGSIEFDGKNIIITYIVDFDAETINNISSDSFENMIVDEWKATPTSLSEMRQLNDIDTDFIIIYRGANGGTKSVCIDTAQF